MNQVELDHIFIFVKNEQVARQMLTESGLKINYSRKHLGQGTANLCACLDDIFIELIWLDGSEVSEKTKEFKLDLRGQGQGSPFGISWRGEFTCETIDYFPPYLAEHSISIPVAIESLNLDKPFVFKTPGGSPPENWTNRLAGQRQGTRAKLQKCTITVPDPENYSLLKKHFPKLDTSKGPKNIHFEIINSETMQVKNIDWRI